MHEERRQMQWSGVDCGGVSTHFGEAGGVWDRDAVGFMNQSGKGPRARDTGTPSTRGASGWPAIHSRRASKTSMVQPLKMELLTATSSVIGSQKLKPTRNQRFRSTGALKIWKLACSLSAMVPSRSMSFSLSWSRPSPSMYRMRCTAFCASRSDAMPSSSKRPFNSERVRLHRARSSEMSNVRSSHLQ